MPQIGQTVEYHEDGGILRCEILAYEITEQVEKATLRVIGIVAQPRIGPDVKVGDEFSSWHRLDRGAWGGDWRITDAN